MYKLANPSDYLAVVDEAIIEIDDRAFMAEARQVRVLLPVFGMLAELNQTHRKGFGAHR